MSWERTPGAPPPGTLAEHIRKSEHTDPETSTAYSLKRIADALCGDKDKTIDELRSKLASAENELSKLKKSDD